MQRHDDIMCCATDVVAVPFEVRQVTLRKDTSLYDEFQVLDFLGRFGSKRFLFPPVFEGNLLQSPLAALLL